MLKNKQKLFVVIFLIIATISTLCFAENAEADPSLGEVMSSNVPAEGEDSNTEATDDVQENVENPEGTEATEPAESTEGTEGETTEEPELIESDQYLTGDNVNVEPTDYIDGNVYIMGRNVTVSGQIGGDVFIFANNVNLTEESYIYGNLYVCASEVTANGIICDLYAACPTTLTIGETGVVLRDIRATSNVLSIKGNVGRSAFVQANEITIEENAHIYGNFEYTSGSEIVVPSGTVDGSINYTASTFNVNGDNIGDVIYSYALDFVNTLVYTLAVFGLILLVAPKFVEKMYNIAKTKPLPSLGIGLALLILVPIIAVLLLRTVVGIPISFAIFTLYMLLISISFTVTAMFFSNLLGNKFKALSKFHNVFALLIVTLVLWALIQIVTILLALTPLPAFAVSIIPMLPTTVFGLGNFVLSIFKKEN